MRQCAPRKQELSEHKMCLYRFVFFFFVYLCFLFVFSCALIGRAKENAKRKFSQKYRNSMLHSRSLMFPFRCKMKISNESLEFEQEICLKWKYPLHIMNVYLFALFYLSRAEIVRLRSFFFLSQFSSTMQKI